MLRRSVTRGARISGRALRRGAGGVGSGGGGPALGSPPPRIEDMLGRLVSGSGLPAAMKPGKASTPAAARAGLSSALGALKSSGLPPKAPGASPSMSRNASPLRQLLQNFEKDKDLNGGGFGGGGGGGGGAIHHRQQPLRSAAPSTPVGQVLGQGSASVRDSFRRAESLRNNPTPTTPQYASTTKSVSRGILNNLSAALPTSQAVVDSEVPEITSGELRYQQHQERLKHQREKFNRSVPKIPEAPFRRNSQQPQQSQIEQPPLNQIENSTSPLSASFGGTEQESSSQIMDISELKRRMAEKLSFEKGSNSVGRNIIAHRQEGKKKPNSNSATTKPKGTVVKEVSVPSQGLTLRGLSQRLSMRVSDLTSTLERLGEEIQDGSDNALIEADICELVVLEMGLGVKREESSSNSGLMTPSLAAAASVGTLAEIVLTPRAPVVCVMGHVDHGKTTLLDSLRKANVAAGEAGGITQKLSAFSVDVSGRQVVFLDTPGHAAFSKMRSHGAEATDLVVLVVALDDGVRPQTREALRVALEAKCTILVALNKVDKIVDPTERKTARSRVLGQLAEENLLVEDFGGDVLVVEVSGKTGDGVEQLTESLLLQSDILELKAASTGQAEAIVLDAYMEKGRGVVADVLVRWGTLSVGDPIVVDTMFGRVKAMVDDMGNPITTAGPSKPVRLLGLRTVPTAGQELLSVVSEAKARQISERRTRLQELKLQRLQEMQKIAPIPNLSSSTDGTNEAESASIADAPKVPHISVLLKADGVGTLEALEQVVKGLGERTTDVTITVADASVGDVTRSDVERAFTVGNALVLAFNVGLADSATRASAKELDVTIMRDSVIYRLEDSLRTAMQAQMPKERSLVREGSAKVQKVFTMRDKAATAVAGLIVQSGFLRTGSANSEIVYKITRANGEVVLDEADGISAVLKRFKDNVHKVRAWLLSFAS